MKAMLWNVEWHDVPNRRMTNDWFLAETADAAFIAAKLAVYGGACHRLNSFNGRAVEPVDPDSVEGRKIAPPIGLATKGRSAVRVRGNRM